MNIKEQRIHNRQEETIKMSDEKIYTNSQVEQLKNEIHDDFAVLKSKIKPIKFITETIKVRDVRYSGSINWFKFKAAYRIE